MNKKNLHSQSKVYDQSHQSERREAYDDEIDLIELFRVFWSYKYLFVLVTSLSVLAGLVYLKLQTPIYQASYYFSKPDFSNVNELNQSLIIHNQNYGVNFNYFSDTFIFEQFQQKLQSVDSFNQFLSLDEIKNKFISYYQIELSSQENNSNLISLFSKNLNLSCKESGSLIQNKFFDSLGGYCLSFDFPNGDEVVAILNSYFRFVSQQLLYELIESRKLQINNEIERLEKKASDLRSNYFFKKQERIVFLREALAIAKKSGISESIIYQADNRFNMEYMRGSNLIQAELDELTNRNDELFISGLPAINQKISDLRDLSFDKNKIKVYKTELEASVSQNSVNKNIHLRILIFLFIGFVCSIVIILVRHTLSKQRSN